MRVSARRAPSGCPKLFLPQECADARRYFTMTQRFPRLEGTRSRVTRPRRRRSSVATTLLLAIGLLAVASRASAAWAPPADAVGSPSGGRGASPTVWKAERESTSMVATRYQHHNQESEADHTYFYDCVGF